MKIYPACKELVIFPVFFQVIDYIYDVEAISLPDDVINTFALNINNLYFWRSLLRVPRLAGNYKLVFDLGSCLMDSIKTENDIKCITRHRYRVSVYYLCQYVWAK